MFALMFTNTWCGPHCEVLAGQVATVGVLVVCRLFAQPANAASALSRGLDVATQLLKIVREHGVLLQRQSALHEARARVERCPREVSARGRALTYSVTITCTLQLLVHYNYTYSVKCQLLKCWLKQRIDWRIITFVLKEHFSRRCPASRSHTPKFLSILFDVLTSLSYRLPTRNVATTHKWSLPTRLACSGLTLTPRFRMQVPPLKYVHAKCVQPGIERQMWPHSSDLFERKSNFFN